MAKRFSDVRVNPDKSFSGREEIGIEGGPVNFDASFPLFLIREAWHRGMNAEDLADGFGEGLGTCDGDWSGIRDSSEKARNLMLERALNFLFPRRSS